MDLEAFSFRNGYGSGNYGYFTQKKPGNGLGFDMLSGVVEGNGLKNGYGCSTNGFQNGNGDGKGF